jgi:glycosyltransferase involved in cell wall biosynthesis
MPVRNGERFLERAVRSVLAQDYRDFELIIVDNASDDGTQAVAERLAAADSRVLYHRNPENVGAARNFCLAFELARGRYFRWAAYDDWLEPTYLSRCVDVLEREPDAVLVFPGTNVYDEDGNLVKQYRHPAGLTSDRVAERFFNSLWNWKYATAIFGLVRTDALAKTGLIKPYKGSDRILFSEIVLLGGVRELSEHLFNSTETVSVRRGRDNAWWSAQAPSRPTYDRWRMLGDFVALVARTPSFGPVDRIRMTGAVLLFFCRRWPRGALLEEVRAGARYHWHRVAGPFGRAAGGGRRRAQVGVGR